MSTTQAQLNEDISELTTIIAGAKSERIKTFLSDKLQSLRDQVDLLNDNSESQPSQDDTPEKQQVDAPKMPENKSLKWVPITKFGWDQDGGKGKNISIYVSLPGVGKLVSKVTQTVTCDFTDNSFDLKVVGLDGKDLRLYKNKLEKNIVPDKCKFKVKPDKVVITLRKEEDKYGVEHWTALTGSGGAGSKKSDPQAGLMDLMKNMYDNGDDEMRKTIGEAMSKTAKGDLPGMAPGSNKF